MGRNRTRMYAVVGLAIVAIAQQTLAQTATFAPTGRIDTNKVVKIWGVSPGGSYAVGEAVDANNVTHAVIWSANYGIQSIGIPAGYVSSVARDVAVSSISNSIKVCGYAKDGSNVSRAFLWSGPDASGVGGTFTMITPLPGGNTNEAYALVVQPGSNPENVFVTGRSDSTASTGSNPEGFRYRSDSNSSLSLGFLGWANDKYSVGYAISFNNNQTEIAGASRSAWSGNGPTEAAVHESSDSSWHGHQGLTQVCGGEGWQILAGANGIAETAAQGTNLQVTPVGTSGLHENTVVVSAGPGNVIKGVTNAQGDDILAPAGLDAHDYGGESMYRGISPDGRFMVGESVYVGAPGGYRQAMFHDPKNRDYSSPDNCGGFGFSWPLGFLTVDNNGGPTPEPHTRSVAYGISNGTGGQFRNNLVIVGSSTYGGGSTYPRRAFVCLIQAGPDVWFLRQQGASPEDPGAHVASTFKQMFNLQWLLTYYYGIDLSGWDLREATAVSDNGTVVVGYGTHNGVEEGFVVTLPTPALPNKGACCDHATQECSLEYPGDCQADFLGPDTVCGRCCPLQYGDTDDDQDVDMDDFAVLQRCITTGGGIVSSDPRCSCLDSENDGDIDDDDVSHFNACASGSDNTADPACQTWPVLP